MTKTKKKKKTKTKTKTKAKTSTFPFPISYAKFRETIFSFSLPFSSILKSILRFERLFSFSFSCTRVVFIGPKFMVMMMKRREKTEPRRQSRRDRAEETEPRRQSRGDITRPGKAREDKKKTS
jgi:hypothetical protein